MNHHIEFTVWKIHILIKWDNSSSSSSIRFIRQTTDQIDKPRLNLHKGKIQKLKEKD